MPTVTTFTAPLVQCKSTGAIAFTPIMIVALDDFPQLLYALIVYARSGQLSSWAIPEISHVDIENDNPDGRGAEIVHPFTAP
jgi:hypothetical protein